MTDADLIYDALLRVEKRFEADLPADAQGAVMALHLLAMGIVQTIREEIGNGLAKEVRLAEAKQGRDALS